MHLNIKDHKIVDDYDARKYLNKLKDGKYVLRLFKRPRTLDQNSYMRGGVYDIIAEATGEDPKVIHEQMRYKFLKVVEIINGQEFERLKSTTELSTVEFTTYLENVKLFRSEFMGIVFPTPDEYNALFQ